MATTGPAANSAAAEAAAQAAGIPERLALAGMLWRVLESHPASLAAELRPVAAVRAHSLTVYYRADAASRRRIFLELPGAGFLEYAAIGEMIRGTPLPELLRLVRLPATLQAGGHTWRAEAHQPWDPALFAGLRPAPPPPALGGKDALQAEDGRALYLRGEYTVPAPRAAGGQAVPGAAGPTGSIYIRYQAR